MSTIAPGRLFNVTDAASFVALSQQNWIIASEELFCRLTTYESGALKCHARALPWAVQDGAGSDSKAGFAART